MYYKASFVKQLFSVKMFLKNLVLCKASSESVQAEGMDTDQDVQMEKQNTDTIIKEQTISDYAIVASNLEKQYFGLKAVRGISFSIERGMGFNFYLLNKLFTHV